MGLAIGQGAGCRFRGWLQGKGIGVITGTGSRNAQGQAFEDALAAVPT